MRLSYPENPCIKPMIISTTLAILSGIFWTATYLLIVRRSIQDKSVGMPFIAICLNISWEFIFSFIFSSHKPQLYINYVWFFLDLIILIQYLRFGKLDFRQRFSKITFYATFFSVLAVSFLDTLFIVYDFGTSNSATYIAFHINLIMSMLFIHMLWSRDSVAGQSVYIAIAKMIGTVCASLSVYLLQPSSILLAFLYVSIFFFDCVYLVLLYLKIREQQINPWKRA